eukprot:3627465-Amphidinium_carterae.2
MRSCSARLRNCRRHGRLDQNGLYGDASVRSSGAGYSWAVGASNRVYPMEAGAPVNSSTKYWVMQTHYYNPNLVTGLKDNSGLKLTLTPTLRPMNMGNLLSVGAVNSIQAAPLPPGESSDSLDMHVPSSCLEAAFDSMGIQEHGLGQKTEIQVFRDGVDIGAVRDEKMYDFQHQSGMPGRIPTIRRNDSFRLRCLYDTTMVSVNLQSLGTIRRMRCAS